MPYASNAALPADVKRRFSDRCQTVWRQVWNDTFERHNNEGRAFATAETAGQQCMASTKATLSSSARDNLPDSAFACVRGSGDSKTRLYPHHRADGSIDLPHLRNALSRVVQQATDSCGKGHLEAHARELGIGEETKSMSMAVKSVGSDTIEGLAIPYGGLFDGRDVDGEYFTQETDLCLDWFGKSGRPLLYDHGLDPTHEAVKVGSQIEYEARDDGIWAQAQIAKNARYRKKIDELIEQQVLGFSSGAYAHMARKDKSGRITRWPWVELSLTPTPAAGELTTPHYVKSAQLVDLLGDDLPVAAMKAIAEWADDRDAAPGSESFADRAGRVSAAVGEFRDYAREYADMRAKAGRVLSEANWTRLRSFLDAIEEASGEVRELLADTDPNAASKSADELWAAIIEAERAKSARLGVPLG